MKQDILQIGWDSQKGAEINLAARHSTNSFRYSSTRGMGSGTLGQWLRWQRGDGKRLCIPAENFALDSHGSHKLLITDGWKDLTSIGGR